ncbi:MAG: ABC-type transport auxiliary lipoprotein family protein, partial [Thermodesulfobacteriota bacterium]|nr:ABC-type transport auxiliary lipoprotein family protein [Thermodesulfobacteriota bacterium]
MLLSLLRIQLVVVLTGTLLSGCISTTTPNTKFYVLNPLDSGISLVSKTECYGLLSLEVASLRLPQYLERPQIVTRSSENRLDLAEFHQWGGNLRKNMIRVLGKNLSQLLATPNIT